MEREASLTFFGMKTYIEIRLTPYSKSMRKTKSFGDVKIGLFYMLILLSLLHIVITFLDEVLYLKAF